MLVEEDSDVVAKIRSRSRGGYRDFIPRDRIRSVLVEAGFRVQTDILAERPLRDGEIRRVLFFATKEGGGAPWRGHAF